MNKIQETKAREMSVHTTKALEVLREVQQTEETNYLRNKMLQQLEYYEMLLFEQVEYDYRALAVKTHLAQTIIEKYN